MIKKQFFNIPLLIIGICLSTLSLFAQNDAAKIAEAKYALEKMKDCNAAKQALDEVSEGGRSQPLYVYYMAKTLDCLEDFDGAIKFYTKYLEFVPDNAEITQRLAELNFAARKDKELYNKLYPRLKEFLDFSRNKLYYTYLSDINYTIDSEFNIWCGNIIVFQPYDFKKIKFIDQYKFEGRSWGPYMEIAGKARVRSSRGQPNLNVALTEGNLLTIDLNENSFYYKKDTDGLGMICSFDLSK